MEPTSNDVVQSGEGQKPTEQTIDVQKVMEELKALKTTNERLLDESKAWKSKYQTVATEKSTIEKTKLEKEGNFEELLRRTTEEKEAASRENEQLKKQYLRASARSILAEVAKDAHDISDLMRLEEIKAVQYDEGKMEVVRSSVEDFVNEIKVKKPWMFGSVKLPSMTDGKPMAAQPSTKSIEKMSASEKADALKNSLKTLF